MHDVDEAARRVLGRHGREAALDDLHDKGALVVGLERPAQGAALVEDDAQSPQVAGPPVGLVLHELRREIVGRTHHCGREAVGGAQELRHAQVPDFHGHAVRRGPRHRTAAIVTAAVATVIAAAAAAAAEEDVGRLHVAVQHALAVNVVQPQENLHENRPDARLGHGAHPTAPAAARLLLLLLLPRVRLGPRPLDGARKVPRVALLHDDKQVALVDEAVEVLHHLRVVHRREELHLVDRRQLLLARQLRDLQLLHHVDLVVGAPPGPEHGAERPFPELPKELKVRRAAPPRRRRVFHVGIGVVWLGLDAALLHSE